MADGSAKVTFDWGDGEQIFRLDMKRLRELQDKCDAGPLQIYNRLRDGVWRVADLRETIRLGLIGGGMDEVKASKLMRDYFDESPMMKHIPAAQAILLALLMGPADDTPEGKEKRGRETTGESPSADSSVQPAQ